MLKINIVNIEKKQIIATGEPYLEVEAKFTIGKEVFTKMLGYPVETTKEAILEDLNKHLSNEKIERSQRESNIKAEAQNVALDDTISSLQGEEIIATEDETVTTDKTKVSKKNGSKSTKKKSNKKS